MHIRILAIVLGAIIFVISILTFTTAQKSRKPDHLLAQDVYVWQRTWKDDLDKSFTTLPSQINRVRILAAEFDQNGGVTLAGINTKIYQNITHSIVLVFRVNGQLQPEARNITIDKINQLYKSLSTLNTKVKGIEIDHDCATNRLGEYTIFLQTVKKTLPQDISLSITALPAWMDSAQFDDVVSAVDNVVLQVHSVQSPDKGLFNEKTALTWITQYAKHFKKSFFVALPDYGLKVDYDQKGKVVAIQGEQQYQPMSAKGIELLVDPMEVQRVIESLKKIPQVEGIAWFRLPLSNDQRIWSYTTWVKVVAGEQLTKHINASLSLIDEKGGYDIKVNNLGDIDSELPAQVMLDMPQRCDAFDAVNDYEVIKKNNTQISFQLKKIGYLRSGASLTVGWVRCNKDATPHVSIP